MGEIEIEESLNIKPINYSTENVKFLNYNYIKLINKNHTVLKLLPINFEFDFNSHHPYNRNNGTLIPNRGYQHLINFGLYFKNNFLTVQINPEQHFSQNLKFDGFWEGHYDEIWAKRYLLWNRADIPERFGNKRHNNLLLGQSKFLFNFKNLSFGFSNQNLWWGPSIRNSIMMSNHSRAFNHLTLHTNKPLKTILGNFEFQLISGKLKNSGFDPPSTDRTFAGTKLFVPKRNKLGETDDWRFLQSFILNYSPPFIDGFSIGFIRWVQMYSAAFEGKYNWIEGRSSYFPVFQNLFRKNDKYERLESQINQAAGMYFKWIWKKSGIEIYGEYHHNDSKFNLRDLLLDSDHSRAATVGFQKHFNSKKNKDYIFSWEWTQMEQTASRLLRNAGSWYQHHAVFDGFTNYGEVLGSSIGPGSNSHYISLKKIKDKNIVGLAFEVVDNDNDFFHEAFSQAKDFRRYWKDFNLHLNINKNFSNFNINANIIFNRSLNYQWELDDYDDPYYHPGKDVNNFHFNIKLTYFTG